MSFEAIAILRAFQEVGAPEELGSAAHSMMAAICIKWDQLRCAVPVRFPTTVMCARTGMSRTTLPKVRMALVERGWLVYRPGANRKSAPDYEPQMPDWLGGSVPRGTGFRPPTDLSQTNDGPTEDEPRTNQESSPEVGSGLVSDSSDIRSNIGGFRPRLVEKQAHIDPTTQSRAESQEDMDEVRSANKRRMARTLSRLLLPVPDDPEKRERVIQEWVGLCRGAGIFDPDQMFRAIETWTTLARHRQVEVRYARDLQEYAECYRQDQAKNQADDDELQEAQA